MSTHKTLILEAYARSDGDGPAWAKASLTPEIMATIGRLSVLCVEQELSSVTTLSALDAWDQEAELRLRGDELVVTERGVWFKCHPKHAEYECETRVVEISTLRKALAGESDGESIVEGDIVFQNQTVKDAYTEHLAGQNPGEGE